MVLRFVRKQQLCSNSPESSPLEFCKRALVIKFLTWNLCCLLRSNVCEKNIHLLFHFWLYNLLLEMKIQVFNMKVKQFSSFYELQDSNAKMNQKNKHSKEQLKVLNMADLVEEAEIFYVNKKKVPLISLVQPCTTCTTEHPIPCTGQIWLKSNDERGAYRVYTKKRRNLRSVEKVFS